MEFFRIFLNFRVCGGRGEGGRREGGGRGTSLSKSAAAPGVEVKPSPGAAEPALAVLVGHVGVPAEEGVGDAAVPLGEGWKLNKITICLLLLLARGGQWPISSGQVVEGWALEVI